MPELEYGWKRFWMPRGQVASCDFDGFLLNPDSEEAHYHPNVARSLEDFSSVQCLVLLGAPGIGKSRTLKSSFGPLKTAIEARGDLALWFHLRTFGSEQRLVETIFRHPDVLRWVQGNCNLHLYLDGFDEGLLNIDTLASLLGDELEKLPRERLTLRICSRPGDWPLNFERQLNSLWPKSIEIVDMAPLRRSDIMLAAAVHGFSLDECQAFLEEVIRCGAVPLAVAPVTLGFLLKTFGPERSLPSSRHEVYFEGCKFLTEELPARQETPMGRDTLTALQKLQVASRIAAFTQLSNRSSVTSLLDADEGQISVQELAGDDEGSGSSFVKVSLEDIRGVLDCGLFTSAAGNLLTWRHQSYCEYLCAYYLHSRRLDLGSLQTLLFHEDGSGKVIPQLREVVRWLAGMDRDLLLLVARQDAEILLQADLTNVLGSDLIEIARRVLDEIDAIENPTSIWQLRAYFQQLKTPDLSFALRGYILDSNLRDLTRAAAIEMASMCKLTSLSGELLKTALDPAESILVRTTAASGFGELCPGDVARLVPLALGRVGNDPDDELKGIGLRTCWPQYLTPQDLFGALTEPKSPRWIGFYATFIGSPIAAHLDESGVLVALDWSRKRCRDEHRHGLGKLAVEIVLKAVELVASPAIQNSLAEALFERACEYGLGDRVPAAIQALNDQQRLTLFRKSLPLATRSQHGELHLISAFCIHSRDCIILLREFLENQSHDERAILAKVIARNINYEDVDAFADILRVSEQNDELGDEITPVLRPVVLASPEAEELKRYWQLSHGNPPEARRELGPENAVKSALVRVGDDQFFYAYWGLFRHRTVRLTREEPLPGWPQFSLDLRQALLDAAVRYVQIPPPTPDGEWWKEGRFTWGILAGVCAFNLLATESPQLLDGLSDAVWMIWAPICLTVTASADETLTAKTLAMAYARQPEAFCGRFEDLIRADNERLGDTSNAIRRLGGLWGDRIADLLYTLLEDDSFASKSWGAILAALLEHRHEATYNLLRDLIGRGVPTEVTSRDRYLAAAVELIAFSPEDWPAFWEAVQGNHAFFEDFLKAAATKHSFGESLAKLRDPDLGDICIWMAERKLQKPLNAEEGMFGEPLPQLWNSLVNLLVGRGTTAACSAIGKLVQLVPEWSGLRVSLAQARENARRHAWRPLSPDLLRGSLHRPGAKIVASLHGIRTRGEWQKQITADLGKSDFIHYPLDFDWFRAWRLLNPVSRKRKIEWFRKEYNRVVTESGTRPSMIAHSFGTYILSVALQEYEELRFDRIILCGSIVRCDYDWNEVVRSGRARAVLNDYGHRDIWPRLTALIQGAGPSGTRGFDHAEPPVYQSAHPNFGHSDYFSTHIYLKSWIPFLRGVKPEVERI